MIRLPNIFISKKNKNIFELAKKWNVSTFYIRKNLRVGIRLESKNSNNRIIQQIQALHNLNENIDYYKK